MTAIWRPAATWCARFEVSSDGRIRNRFTKRELALNVINGYLSFTTRKGRAGRAYCYKVHRLVALAFIGPRPTGAHVVNHKDGVKTNNAVKNLEWVTLAQNVQHAYGLGLMRPKRGVEHEHARLTDARVRFIRRAYQPRHPVFGCRPLARHFGVDHSVVSQVINGKLWTHVTDHPNTSAGSSSVTQP